MSAPKTPAPLIWLKVFLRSNLHRVSRKLRGDTTEVHCVEDLEGPPPPPYERRLPKTPPAEGEIRTLRYELCRYEAWLRALPEDSLARRQLVEDHRMLDRWLGHLEYLHAENVGRTVPARLRREPYRDRIVRRIKNVGKGKEPASPAVCGIMW